MEIIHLLRQLVLQKYLLSLLVVEQEAGVILMLGLAAVAVLDIKIIIL
jgi:hypothetical protein